MRRTSKKTTIITPTIYSYLLNTLKEDEDYILQTIKTFNIQTPSQLNSYISFFNLAEAGMVLDHLKSTGAI